MFSAVDFSDSGSDTDTAPPPIKKARAEPPAARTVGHSAPTSSEPVAARNAAGFHQPGDPAFAIVATPTGDRAAAREARFATGDAWAAGECRCLRCELLRASGAMAALDGKLPAAGGRAVLVLDLDNFGFPQFKGTAGDALLRLLTAAEGRGVFVWAFYGACFARFFKVDAADYVEKITARGVLRAPAPRPTGKNKKAKAAVPGTEQSTPQRSGWSALKLGAALHVTRCGGESQAADAVIGECVRLLAAVAGRPVAIATGDQGLLASCQKALAPCAGLVVDSRKQSADDVWMRIDDWLAKRSPN